MDLFGCWQPFNTPDCPIYEYFMWAGKKSSVDWLVDAISRMCVSQRYGFELGFYDIKFVDETPNEWRGMYFHLPEEKENAFDALVDLTMTHNLVGVNVTRGDLMFELSSDHQTNINGEVVGTFLGWLKDFPDHLDDPREM